MLWKHLSVCTESSMNNLLARSRPSFETALDHPDDGALSHWSLWTFCIAAWDKDCLAILHVLTSCCLKRRVRPKVRICSLAAGAVTLQNQDAMCSCLRKRRLHQLCNNARLAAMQVGFRTWYPGAEARYVERCKLKDAATTQAALGFKICGMQARLLHALVRAR